MLIAERRSNIRFDNYRNNDHHILLMHAITQAFKEQNKIKRRVGMIELRQKKKETLRKFKEDRRRKMAEYTFEHEEDPDLEGAHREALGHQHREESTLQVLLQRQKEAEQEQKQVGLELERSEEAVKVSGTELKFAEEAHREIQLKYDGARERWLKETNMKLKLDFENFCLKIEGNLKKDAQQLELVKEQNYQVTQWVERMLSQQTEAAVRLEGAQFRVKQQRAKVDRETRKAEKARDVAADNIPRGMHVRAPGCMARPKVFTGKVASMLKSYGTAPTALKLHNGDMTHHAQRYLASATGDLVVKRSVFRAWLSVCYKADVRKFKASENARICVILLTSRGLFVPIVFSKMATGLQIKQALHERRGYDPDTQTLLYRDAVIHNKDTLRDHDVGDNCTVKVLLA